MLAPGLKRVGPFRRRCAVTLIQCLLSCLRRRYQVLYHSVTGQGTGQWDGLAFQQQFIRALQVSTPSHPAALALTLYALT